MEIWKLINGTRGYEISNYGNVRRIEHFRTHTRKDGTTYQRHYDARIMKPSLDQDGYLVIELFHEDLGRYFYTGVHRIVAEHFLLDWDPNLQVNHLNGNKSDNRVENLEMATCKENIEHFWKHPLMKERRERKLIRVSNKSKEVMSRPDVKIREAEKQGTHVLCIEDNIAFASRSVCSKYYGVDYSLIDSRCKRGIEGPKRRMKLKYKNFKYLSEDEYQIFKRTNPERVVIYV